jgi:dTDP-4-amino-4,6-dideoxygalactose transaminase
MDNNLLAINGGKPVISDPFPKYTSFDEKELEAVTRVMKSGVLSAYVGDLTSEFMGGPEVQALEKKASILFNVNYVVAVNSWTSGLVCAVGALDLPKNSEVITSSWTMAATATCLLPWNLIPMFADIDSRTFNLNPAEVEKLINKNTRAIIAPDIFGQSCDIEKLKDLCIKYDLKLISDSAQSPMATRNDYFAGTRADIGGISLNHHKHISCGEGGLLFTDDEEIYKRLLLIRNHGEVLVGKGYKVSDKEGIYGFNFRLGELESAITSCQLDKLPGKVKSRQLAASRLSEGLSEIEGLELPYVEEINTHAYYIYGIKLNQEKFPDRNRIVNELKAEGLSFVMKGYQNIHKLPIYEKKNRNDGLITNKKNNLSQTEFLHENSFIGINLCAHEYTEIECDLIIRAFKKVLNRNLK